MKKKKSNYLLLLHRWHHNIMTSSFLYTALILHQLSTQKTIDFLYWSLFSLTVQFIIQVLNYLSRKLGAGGYLVLWILQFCGTRLNIQLCGGSSLFSLSWTAESQLTIVITAHLSILHVGNRFPLQFSTSTRLTFCWFCRQIIVTWDK